MSTATYTTLDELYAGLQELLVEVLGLAPERVILADQGRPSPPGPEVYATYKPYVVRAVGAPQRERELVPATEDFNEDKLGTDWEDFEETTITQAELLVSVNCIGDGASNTIWRLVNTNWRWPIQEKLWALNLGWRGVSEIRRLTEVLDAGIQSRHQADVNLMAGMSITDTVLRAAGFAYSIEDEAGNTIAEGTV